MTDFTSSSPTAELCRLPSLRKLLNPAEDPPRKNDVVIPSPCFRGRWHSFPRLSKPTYAYVPTQESYPIQPTNEKVCCAGLPSINNLLGISITPSAETFVHHAQGHGHSDSFLHEHGHALDQGHNYLQGHARWEVSSSGYLHTHVRMTKYQHSEHERIHRQVSEARLALSRTKRMGYPCERCGRIFGRKADALKHIRVVHEKLKIFSCRVCCKRFARKDYCMV